MRHRKRVESPPRQGEHGAGRYDAQPVTAFVFRPNRLGEVPAHESYRLAAADDVDRAVHPIESERCEEPSQPQHMIEMGMRQQHMTEPAKADPGTHQLALGSLTAIDEETIGPSANDQRRQPALRGGYGSGGTEKCDVEQLHLPSAVILGHHVIQRRPRRWGGIPARRV